MARIGKTKIAIDVKQIHFVIRNNGIVPFPDMPEWMEGIISFRDKVIPIVNNKRKFEFENDNTEKKRIVLCEIKDKVLFGLNIDQYLDIIKVEDKQVKKMTLKKGEEVIPIIDLKKLITEEEIEFAKRI
ncbi:purine-binding chemotaxis protein CheW [Thermotomaculum hydrothermale]|uniref:Purine-binding chemotaxis protein CheW n=1 Tax=Thermotomaculum hydrothermale TaxID=981385 RepID=A0A7R6PPY1_9BACT|nr:chemotaxis protein CheW [Thermotomaculum hydrothermale]BBB33668.1 purine-binding chemotaxis protein CheW [Thermotomaculum hydrothermale]